MYRAPYLYTFMQYCESEKVEKSILECGSGTYGDSEPLLARFYRLGYRCSGIDISAEALETSKQYAEKHQMEFSLSIGDMRQMEVEDASFGAVYSYNSIFHMNKADIQKSIIEIHRVLKPGGVCFVNFLSTEDGEYGEGEEVEKDVFAQKCATMDSVLHAYFELNEADSLFTDFKILFKEKRWQMRYSDKQSVPQAYLDYILVKS